MSKPLRTQPSEDSLQARMTRMGEDARAAAAVLRDAGAEQRSAAIVAMAQALRTSSADVLEANARDLAKARAARAGDNVVDRLALDAAGVEAVAAAVDAVAAQPDPVGVELARWTRPNGLDLARVSVPIGVLAVIYESRPNVTADAAALAIRSGNGVILRCGSEALETSLAIHRAVAAGLRAAGLPETGVQLVPTADREAVGLILGGLEGAVDLIIPRGGKGLVERVGREARAPVLGHLEGICHTFVHRGADPEMAREIVVNAKMRRTSVCGATETLLVDAAEAARLLPPIAAALAEAGCELRGDEAARRIAPMAAAAQDDWGREFLAPIIAVGVVDGVDGAIAHIARYGSGHTEAIVTEDGDAAEEFLRRVDSAIVLWNASTQFADGGEFGFGAEIGISTARLHARGPVGAEQLTTYKYVVRGAGQTRP